MKPAHPASKEEALALNTSRFWKHWTSQEIAEWQLSCDTLVVDPDDYMAALKDALQRPVYPHELATPHRLLQELRKEKVTAPRYGTPSLKS